MKKKVLAIIPARAQSKRIKNKNIKNFLGYPIIKYSIEAAIASNCFDEIMVSTEDANIAAIAMQYKAKVPFFRSKKNADDFATTASVIEEVLLKYNKRKKFFDYICCIYPAAPFVTSEILQKTYEILVQQKNNGLVPVICNDYPIQRALCIKNDRVQFYFPENINKRSQDLEKTYHDAGQFYWLKEKAFMKEKTIFLSNCFPYIVSDLCAHDIDTEEDWQIAEIKYQNFTKICYN